MTMTQEISICNSLRTWLIFGLYVTFGKTFTIVGQLLGDHDMFTSTDKIFAFFFFFFFFFFFLIKAMRKKCRNTNKTKI